MLPFHDLVVDLDLARLASKPVAKRSGGERHGRRYLCVLRLYSQKQVCDPTDLLIPLLQLRRVRSSSVFERWARLDRKQLTDLLFTDKSIVDKPGHGALQIRSERSEAGPLVLQLRWNPG